MNFVGPTGSACRQAIDKRFFTFILDLEFHLRESLWTLELEHALEKFSIRTYLNWIDQRYSMDDDIFSVVFFPEMFLNYLKDKVSNPAFKLGVRFSFSSRENLAFMTSIACATWNILRLPSTVPPSDGNIW